MPRCLRVGFALALVALVVTGCGQGLPTWSTRTVPNGINMLNDVVCPSTTQCYAVGGDGTAGPGSIIGSSDGGDHWQLLMTTPQVQLLAIACSDSGTCVVGGEANSTFAAEKPQVFLTRDHGAHWSRETLPPLGGVDGAACSSVTVCLIIGGRAIARTTNGGMTWVTERTPTDLAEIDSVACPTRSFCIVGGTGSSPSLPGPSANSVSQDAGATWSKAVVVSGPIHTGGGNVVESGLGAVSCSGPQNCVGVSQSPTFASLGNGSPSVTSDGGSEWTRGSGTVGGALSCIANLCVSVGGRWRGPDTTYLNLVGAAYVSTDGGVDWSRSRIPTRRVLTAVSCPSSTHCVAVGGDFLEQPAVILTDS